LESLSGTLPARTPSIFLPFPQYSFCATPQYLSKVLQPHSFSCHRLIQIPQKKPLGVANPLDSRRSRLKLLHQRIADLDLANQTAKPIPTIRIRTCSHPECGVLCTTATKLPQDALLIQMGCKYLSPQAQPASAE
jgi:hypothetical protein